MHGFCPHCEDYRQWYESTRPETYTVKGIKVTISVTTARCIWCCWEIVTDAEDEAIHKRIIAEYERVKDEGTTCQEEQ